VSAGVGEPMTWFDVAVQIPGIDLAYGGVQPDPPGGGSGPGLCSHCCGWDRLCLPFETAGARGGAEPGYGLGEALVGDVAGVRLAGNVRRTGSGFDAVCRV